MKLDDAARAYNKAYPGFGAGGALPSQAELEFQMAKALQYANQAEFSDAYKSGNGYLHQLLSEVAKVAPDAAILFNTSLIENKQQEPLVKSLEFMLAAQAERSPETWDHIRRHTALAMQFYSQQHGSLTLRNRDEALQVMVGALAHDAGKIGIDTSLLHKHTRIDPARFDEALANYIQAVPNYPQRAHDIQFLQLAQTGKLVFAPPETVMTQPTGIEMIALQDGKRRGERALIGYDQPVLHNHIMSRINDKAKQAGFAGWLSADEQAQLASTVRGTLTEQERNILNTHDPMSALYLSLQSLPQELSNVPAIVSMDGFRTGVAGQNSEASNLIHLTDVFEALVSKRSYKEPYPVSDALCIMNRMAQRGSLDSRMLQQFIDSQVWKDFAQRNQCELGDLSAIGVIQTPAPEKAPSTLIEPSTVKWQSLAMPTQQANITLNINVR